MKAIVMEKPGTLNGLVYTENRTVPNPGWGEIRIQVEAVGLNPVDYKLVKGWGDVKWEKSPVLGLDVAGKVDALGEGVTGFFVGERVVAHGNFSRPDGGYAEYSLAPAYAVTHLPDSISAIDAAALPCPGYTAYQAVLLKLRVQEGKTILVHAGAGGVGGYAIQLAKMKNLTVYTTCSASNVNYVKTLGADKAFKYMEYDIYDKIMDETGGRGVDYIVNTVDADTATKDVDLLAFHGELAAIVELPHFSRLSFYEKGMSIHEVALGGTHINGDSVAKQLMSELASDFISFVEQKMVKPLPTQTIKLKEIPEYLEKLEQRHVSGKIVAKVE